MEKINLTDFQRRKLKECYIAVYVITKEVKIRTETCITNKKLYLLFGIDFMGYRQILGIYFDNENSSRFWLEKFEDFKARNVKDILFLVTPCNRNVERCIKIVYNNVNIIHSPDNIFESVTKFWANESSRKAQIAFKDLFLTQDIEKFQIDLELFKNVYVDNRIIMLMLDKKTTDIKSFYQYNQQLRNLFYPFYTIREMKFFLNKIKNKDPLCTCINEVIEFCLPFINSFENGRNYSKKEWLVLISSIYDEYQEKLEEYLNV